MFNAVGSLFAAISSPFSSLDTVVASKSHPNDDAYNEIAKVQRRWGRRIKTMRREEYEKTRPQYKKPQHRQQRSAPWDLNAQPGSPVQPLGKTLMEIFMLSSPSTTHYAGRPPVLTSAPHTTAVAVRHTTAPPRVALALAVPAQIAASVPRYKRALPDMTQAAATQAPHLTQGLEAYLNQYGNANDTSSKLQVLYDTLKPNHQAGKIFTPSYHRFDPRQYDQDNWQTLLFKLATAQHFYNGKGAAPADPAFSEQLLATALRELVDPFSQRSEHRIAGYNFHSAAHSKKSVIQIRLLFVHSLQAVLPKIAYKTVFWLADVLLMHYHPALGRRDAPPAMQYGSLEWANCQAGIDLVTQYGFTHTEFSHQQLIAIATAVALTQRLDPTMPGAMLAQVYAARVYNGDAELSPNPLLNQATTKQAINALEQARTTQLQTELAPLQSALNILRNLAPPSSSDLSAALSKLIMVSMRELRADDHHALIYHAGEILLPSLTVAGAGSQRATLGLIIRTESQTEPHTKSQRDYLLSLKPSDLNLIRRITPDNGNLLALIIAQKEDFFEADTLTGLTLDSNHINLTTVDHFAAILNTADGTERAAAAAQSLLNPSVHASHQPSPAQMAQTYRSLISSVLHRMIPFHAAQLDQAAALSTDALLSQSASLLQKLLGGLSDSSSDTLSRMFHSQSLHQTTLARSAWLPHNGNLRLHAAGPRFVSDREPVMQISHAAHPPMTPLKRVQYGRFIALMKLAPATANIADRLAFLNGVMLARQDDSWTTRPSVFDESGELHFTNIGQNTVMDSSNRMHTLVQCTEPDLMPCPSYARVNPLTNRLYGQVLQVPTLATLNTTAPTIAPAPTTTVIALPEQARLLTQGLHHYFQNNYQERDASATRKLTLLFDNLMPQARKTRRPGDAYHPYNLRQYDQAGLQELLQALALPHYFYSGAQETPADPIFSQQLLAAALRELIDPHSNRQPYTIAGYHFLDAARSAYTVGAVRQAFIAQVARSIPGLTENMVHWLSSVLLATYEPALARTDTPHTMRYVGLDWSNLQIAIDTLKNFGLDHWHYSHNELASIAKTIALMPRVNDQLPAKILAPQVYAALRFDHANTPSADPHQIEQATAAIIEHALKHLDQARTAQLQQELAPLQNAAKTLNTPPTTRQAIARTLLIERGIDPDASRNITLFDRARTRFCSGHQSNVELYLADCGGDFTAIPPLLPHSVAAMPDLNQLFNAQFKSEMHAMQDALQQVLIASLARLDSDDRRFIRGNTATLMQAKILVGLTLEQKIQVGYPASMAVKTYLGTSSLILCAASAEEKRFYQISISDRNHHPVHKISADQAQVLERIKQQINFFFDLGTQANLPDDRSLWEVQLAALQRFEDADNTRIAAAAAEKLFEPIMPSLQQQAYAMQTAERYRTLITEFLYGLIPFYNCWQNIKHQSWSSALILCPLDIAAATPLLGPLEQSGALLVRLLEGLSSHAMQEISTTFALDLARAPLNQIGAYETVLPLKQVGKNLALGALHAIDPGFCLLGSGMDLLFNRLVQSGKEFQQFIALLSQAPDTARIVEQLKTLEQKQIALQGDAWRASGATITANGQRRSLSDGYRVMDTEQQKNILVQCVDPAYFDSALCSGYVRLNPLASPAGRPYGSIMRPDRFNPHLLHEIMPLPNKIASEFIDDIDGTRYILQLAPGTDIELLPHTRIPKHDEITVCELNGVQYGLLYDRLSHKPYLELLSDITNRLGIQPICRTIRAPLKPGCAVISALDDGLRYQVASDTENLFQEVLAAPDAPAQDVSNIAQVQQRMLVTPYENQAYLGDAYYEFSTAQDGSVSTLKRSSTHPELPKTLTGTLVQQENGRWAVRFSVPDQPAFGHYEMIYGTYRQHGVHKRGTHRNPLLGLVHITPHHAYIFNINQQKNGEQLTLRTSSAGAIQSYNNGQEKYFKLTRGFHLDMMVSHQLGLMQLMRHHHYPTSSADTLLSDIHAAISNAGAQTLTITPELRSKINQAVARVTGNQKDLLHFKENLITAVNRDKTRPNTQIGTLAMDDGNLELILDDFRSLLPSLPDFQTITNWPILSASEKRKSIISWLKTHALAGKNFAYARVMLSDGIEKIYYSQSGSLETGGRIIKTALEVKDLRIDACRAFDALFKGKTPEQIQALEEEVSLMNLPNKAADGTAHQRLRDGENIIMAILMRDHPPAQNQIRRIDLYSPLEFCQSCLTAASIMVQLYPPELEFNMLQIAHAVADHQAARIPAASGKAVARSTRAILPHRYAFSPYPNRSARVDKHVLR